MIFLLVFSVVARRMWNGCVSVLCMVQVHSRSFSWFLHLSRILVLFLSTKHLVFANGNACVCVNDKSGKNRLSRDGLKGANGRSREAIEEQNGRERERERPRKTKSNDLTTKKFLHFIRGYLSANICHMIVRLVHLILVRCLLYSTDMNSFGFEWLNDWTTKKQQTSTHKRKKKIIPFDYFGRLSWITFFWFDFFVCCLAVATLAAVFVLFAF